MKSAAFQKVSVITVAVIALVFGPATVGTAFAEEPGADDPVHLRTNVRRFIGRCAAWKLCSERDRLLRHYDYADGCRRRSRGLGVRRSRVEDPKDKQEQSKHQRSQCDLLRDRTAANADPQGVAFDRVDWLDAIHPLSTATEATQPQAAESRELRNGG